MSRISLFLLSLLLQTVAVAASCNADNCLRALRATARLEGAQSFCATFTTASVTATSAIPSYAVAGCTGNVASRVSSACSCLPTVSPSSSVVTSKSSTSSTAPTSTAGAKICMNPQLSCHNTTVVEDTCCFNAPGGQLLLTLRRALVGPATSWTVHGLWPDHCDGTYDANCDAAREYTNITAILQSYGKTDLLSYMNTYWKDYQGNDESFWEHEWDKHGTCISTLDPKCYSGYTGQEEVADFFDIAVTLFKSLDSYAALEKAGIVPSLTVTYTFDQIQSALTALHGFPVSIMCSGGPLDEIWYHYNVLGSVQTGEFIATVPDGSKSDCAATGIKYLPKYQPTPTGSTSTPTATSVPNTPYKGKGYLQAYTGGANTGCLISAGTWFTTGTCAKYTAAASGDGFTLTSSKGPCAVVSGYFLCATGNTPDVFTDIDGSLGYAGSSAFYAAAVPVGQVQQKVYPTTMDVEVSFTWQSI